MSIPVEMLVEFDSGLSIDPVTSETSEWQGLRVKFRFDGAGRRWRKFLITRTPGQSLLDLLTVAIHVVSLDESRPSGNADEFVLVGVPGRSGVFA